jgi:hypothetical protein
VLVLLLPPESRLRDASALKRRSNSIDKASSGTPGSESSNRKVKAWSSARPEMVAERPQQSPGNNNEDGSIQ